LLDPPRAPPKPAETTEPGQANPRIPHYSVFAGV